jgi:hypothetical protein
MTLFRGTLELDFAQRRSSLRRNALLELMTADAGNLVTPQGIDDAFSNFKPLGSGAPIQVEGFESTAQGSSAPVLHVKIT